MNFDNFTTKTGEECLEILFFGLSTCMWCRKTKAYLDEKGVEYKYLFVDLLEVEEKKEVKKFIWKWNNDLSYPTVVIDQKVCVVGYDTDGIDEELGKK